MTRVTTMRAVVAPGVAVIAVHTARLVGELYRPAGAVSAPGVLALGGSAGGLDRYMRREAALLADHGYAALALAYFGAPGLPHTLAHIPLEHFGRALAWLGRQPGVRGNHLAVVGHSRGGELALLLGPTTRRSRRWSATSAAASYTARRCQAGARPGPGTDARSPLARRFRCRARAALDLPAPLTSAHQGAQRLEGVILAPAWGEVGRNRWHLGRQTGMGWHERAETGIIDAWTWAWSGMG